MLNSVPWGVSVGKKRKKRGKKRKKRKNKN
jgi:hypothetical protein